MVISKATPADLISLIKLEQELFKSDRISKRQFLYNIKRNPFLVAKKNNNLAGYILYFERKKTIRIYSLAVGLNYQGQGVAKALLQYVLAITTKDIYLEVNTHNTGAISLYKKFNFIITKTFNKYYEDGSSAFKMLCRRN
jgi:ribosomal-protein-alanine N-acetyltransferase